LAHLATIAQLVCSERMNVHGIKKSLKARLADTKALLSRHTLEARQMLRKLLVEGLEFTPVEVNGRKGYRFTGAGSYGPLLDGETFSPTVVAPTGYHRRWHNRSALRFMELRAPKLTDADQIATYPLDAPGCR